VIGHTLGHYRIESKLGQGGMGVVYAAHDLHLGRRVAIKVLPPAAVTDPERRQRFVKEAKAASALNHPNILHIYDVDAAVAEDGKPADFIAMEYVSGQTLDRLIAGRGLPVPQALQCAAQIAGGLAAAHAAGIVHRDLKPANVMVNETGLVKILDFGLAKLTEPLEADEIASTQTIQPATRGGAILGTVPYMSPEQAEGKRVDARSDIFSFGSVLYEMITGRRPFAGDSTATTLAAIVHQEPKPISELVKSVPRELERIIAQCLRKDPARRFQHLDDVKILLDQLRDDLDRSKDVTSRESPQPARRAMAPLALATSIGVLLAVSGFVWWKTRPASHRGSGLTRLTSDTGLTTDPALSSDGRLLAYASDRAVTAGTEDNLDIWVQQLPAGEPLRLTRHPADDREPSFAPDGTRIAFRSERDGGGIYTISALGGDERLIASYGRRPVFSPDGESIVYWTGVTLGPAIAVDGKIFVVPALGGQPRQIGVENSWLPVWSPDGKRILFARWAFESGTRRFGGGSEWWLTTLDGTATQIADREYFAEHRLTEPSPVAWLADGDRIVFTARFADSVNVWQVPISTKAWKPTSAPERLTFGSGLETRPSIAVPAGGSARLVFAALVENINIWALPLDPAQGRASGELSRLTQTAAADSNPALTFDGRRLFFTSNRAGNRDIWVKDLASGKETNLTNTPVGEWRPTLTGDGSKVAYRMMETPSPSIWVLPVAQGSQGAPQPGVAQKISVPGYCGYPWSWSSDGRKLLYNCPSREAVRLFDAESGQTTQVLGPLCFQVHFAPDDRWIVFTRQQSTNEREPAFIAPVDRMTASENDWIAVIERTASVSSPRWSPDGNMIYLVSTLDGFRCIWAQRLNPATKRPEGSPVPIYHSHGSRRSLLNVGLNLLEISVARDKIAFPLGEVTGNLWTTTLDGN
jgi:serine/threonine protein kinase/dipeptidyl aminopeptidase/acylaminoacyl peptidase